MFYEIRKKKEQISTPTIEVINPKTSDDIDKYIIEAFFTIGVMLFSILLIFIIKKYIKKRNAKRRTNFVVVNKIS